MSAEIDQLKEFELFTGLSKENLKEVARLTEIRLYSEGDLIFTEGREAESLYLILQGKVSLEKDVQLGRTGTPRKATLTVLGAGQALGWSSLVPPFEYTSSGVCLEAATLVVVPGQSLLQLMKEKPDLGMLILGRISSLIRERMSNATERLSYFLSIVSHELKRPMAAVENYLQIMLGGYAGELNPKQIRLLERSTLRLIDLRNLISDILDFARLQPEQIQADFDYVDPAEIGAEAIEEVRLAASQKNIRLKAIGPSDIQSIVGAHRRLRQVISNLLANAIKFSPENSTVTLSARESEEGLLVEVIDEGVGIPQEDQEHIFEDFFRASNVKEIGGTGLGLSIAKKIIEAHQGTITVESPYAEGQPGSKFSVFIPRGLPLLGALGSLDQRQGERRNTEDIESAPQSTAMGSES